MKEKSQFSEGFSIPFIDNVDLSGGNWIKISSEVGHDSFFGGLEGKLCLPIESTSFSIYIFSHSQDESSVQNLIENCIIEDDKLYICVSSPTIKNKPVQIRPWRLSDADFVLDASMSLDPRKTVFVGGVPRPLKACKFTAAHLKRMKINLFLFTVELAMIMDRLYGGVCYAGIDTDPELKYPKVS